MGVTSISRRVRLRIGLPCTLFLFLSSLDRANLSFAAHSMNADLGFTPAQYGLGAGILFVGFLAGQFPSVLLLQQLGMRAWLASCALLWGASAAAMGFIETPAQLYTVRIILGLAEGGLAPGIVLYLSQFAPERDRAATFSLPMLAIPVSVIVGGPLSGWLLGLHNPFDVPQWRVMFIAEAVPTLIAGVAAALYFPDSPSAAAWLRDSERAWLQQNAARNTAAREVNHWSVLRLPVVPLASLLWFCLLSGAYGLIFWLPLVTASLTDLSPFEVGLFGALPWIGVAAGMYFNATHSDRSGERVWHVAGPSLLAAVGLLAAWLAGVGAFAGVLLVVAGIGLGAAQGAFWALPTPLLPRSGLPVAVVAINIAGSAGGLVMPQLMGYARQQTGGFAVPTLLVAAVLATAAVIVLVIARRYRRELHASAVR